MNNSKQCPTQDCNTEVEYECIVSGDDYQHIWDCPNCAWKIEINTSFED